MRRWRGAAYTYQHEASGEKKRVGIRVGADPKNHTLNSPSFTNNRRIVDL